MAGVVVLCCGAVKGSWCVVPTRWVPCYVSFAISPVFDQKFPTASKPVLHHPTPEHIPPHGKCGDLLHRHPIHWSGGMCRLYMVQRPEWLFPRALSDKSPRDLSQIQYLCAE